MKEDLLLNPVSVPRLCGFANFIAELFLNWEVSMSFFSIWIQEVLDKRLKL